MRIAFNPSLLIVKASFTSVNLGGMLASAVMMITMATTTNAARPV